MKRLAAESKVPELSAIIPALNAAGTIAQCLEAITVQASDDVEVIVVDDGSTDNTFEIASRYNVRLLKLPHNMGPSAARNRGAGMARAPILFFLDADVVLAPGGLVRARAAMSRTDRGAVIGSYDDDPAAATTISRFKNLAHHYFHQRSGADATTLWGACGLVRRELFFAAGGFEENRHQIEDVELGYRMTARGARIVLDRELQVKHLKRWTLRSLVTTEIRARAIPWTLLWLEGHRLPTDLNFSADQRVAAVVAFAIPIAILAAIFRLHFWILVAVLISLAIWVNRDLYRLLFRRGGLLFSVKGFLLQQFYYLYSLAGVAAGVAIYIARVWRLRPIRDDSM